MKKATVLVLALACLLAAVTVAQAQTPVIDSKDLCFAKSLTGTEQGVLARFAVNVGSAKLGVETQLDLSVDGLLIPEESLAIGVGFGATVRDALKGLTIGVGYVFRDNWEVVTFIGLKF